MKIKKTLIAIFIWLVLQVAAGIPYLAGMLTKRGNLTELLVIGLLISQIVEILVFWALKYFKPAEMIKPNPGLKILLISLPLGFSVLYAVNILSLTIDVPDMLSDMMGDLCKSYWGVLSIAVVGPISEEIMMRRIILTEMKEATNSIWGGILISAAIFAIIHVNPAQVIFAFPAGVLLGWLYCKTGSLLVPICVHILNNGFSVLITRMGIDDPVSSLSDPRAIIELVVCAVVATLLIIWMNKHYSNKEEEFPEYQK